jgi:uncharacterized protein
MPRLIHCLAASFLLLWGTMASAALPARPLGPVYDGASVIPDATEAQIDAKLRALSKETGKTLIVATVPSLGGAEIDEYAVRLFESWGVGDKEKDEGALILIAPNERRTRIEVGFGSEGILPDALAGRIIDQQMIPNFKAGNYGEGILQAANAVEQQLRREPTDARAVAAAASAAERAGKRGEGIPIGAIIFMLFIIFFVVLPIIRSLSGGGKKHRRHGYGGPVIIWGGDDWGGGSSGGSSWGGGGSSFGGGGFGGFGGGMSGGGGASGGW